MPLAIIDPGQPLVGQVDACVQQVAVELELLDAARLVEIGAAEVLDRVAPGLVFPQEGAVTPAGLAVARALRQVRVQLAEPVALGRVQHPHLGRVWGQQQGWHVISSG
jgi:hypothetical protein